MKCEIDDARLFLQIIRESRDPLAIIREALSNAYDANASNARVRIWSESTGLVNFEISDNGSGIRPFEFKFFFGLGFGNKVGANTIGNKGLGTKLFFNGERIEVVTRLKTGECYTAVLEGPLAKLGAGTVPAYRVSKNPEIRTPYKHGTTVRIVGLKHSMQSPLLSLDSLASYLKWYTVAGSCHRFFNVRNHHSLSVRLERHGVRDDYCIVGGHELPGYDSPRVSEYNSFASKFDPFRIHLRNDTGEELGVVDVVGSIVGPEGHIVADRRIKKRFKGVFLAKDYFIIKDVNTEVFGGTGEWQNTHVIANCQQLNLTMSRDDLIDRTPGSVYAELISALREFANALRRGEPFRYRGLTIEHRSKCAGKYYAQMKSVRESESLIDSRHLRTFDMLAVSSVPRTKLADDGGPVFEPINHLGVLLVFQALVAKGRVIPSLKSPSGAARFRVLGPLNTATSTVLVQKLERGIWSPPRRYRPAVSLKDIPKRELDGIDGVICWNNVNYDPSVPGSMDVLLLANAV